ncbi:unnamed protein product [Pedinophyceae sp. YPF-701]|nr:unnamed protein product [Pedinophyceae sp. YPF-701]
MGRIRDATPGDLDVVVAFNMAMAKETEDITLDKNVVTPGVAAVLTPNSPHGRYFLLEEDGRVVAQLMITPEWSDWRNASMWWVQSVYVAPEHRRRGHFKALYQHVKEACRAAGGGGLRLYVDDENTRAQETYQKLGMKSHYRLFEDLNTDF